MRQTIAVLGATGPMGSALARRLARAGHRILIAGRSPEKLAALASLVVDGFPGADVGVLDCSREACWEADIIILATPYAAQREIAARISDVVTRKIVVSVANPPPRGAADTSAAEELAVQLPYAHVVKAFNTIPALALAAEAEHACLAECYIAGENGEAVGIVAGLAVEAGCTAVVAGGLSASKELEQKSHHHSPHA